MSNNPLVSVIMPAHNAEKYIEESIHSVIEQTYKNWELIIVDDGSVDSTPTLIKDYQRLENRIKYIYQSRGRQANARNKAIEHSNGTYIAFLDADDIWLPTKLETSLMELCQNDFDLLFTDAFFFTQNENQNVLEMERFGVKNAIYSGDLGVKEFINGNKIPNLTVIVKKHILLSVGKFIDIKVAEDYDMWLKLLYYGATFKAIENPLSVYRLHEESITSSDRNALFECLTIILNFGNNHLEYKSYVHDVFLEKLKFWLYNSNNVTKKRYRLLMSRSRPSIIGKTLQVISYFVPFILLRKLTNKLLLH